MGFFVLSANHHSNFSLAVKTVILSKAGLHFVMIAIFA